MALRKTSLVTGEIYHIFNRSVQGIPIFKGQREASIFLAAMEFYLQVAPPTKFSFYRTSPDRYPLNLEKKLVTIINYCLMPNHFHFTLRQEEKDGIKRFIQKLSNSFAHYFSVKYKNRGPVFEGNFKSVWVENDEQLLHLSRYIHLNPVTAYLAEDPGDYDFSSYGVYTGKKKSNIVNSSMILDNFSSPKKYKEFVLDQKDYQRNLDKMKHLFVE